ncbi:Na+/H+ antiporter [Chryseobacterium indologenes]|uniref:Na+/H+ antiporter n=2 Tax=Chryseobacterium indologenes TaxID=253 RepID=A0AAD0YT73_CHRID|nr:MULTISPECIES: Na+/H+ antiporter [Chryseobacterium]AYZ34968.1 Na+/H+ antiporter [Chryseobacterium indologenes]AZB17820.1 Na+/H+ antiporter [Chryseobacterium indologenes]MBF6643711.1 Na+/H+ antiporter [Chryseobacterium indologenes]MBU3046705.1 Na+/H+ antiporter [Chryseobacterium indologenes]MEB4761619.1 Na+/H+ antiporter [Chryseobacterium indologenes]
MHENFLLILGLLLIVMLLVMLAQKIKIAYPIFLVLAGLGISFIPGVPVLKLDPDIIFLIFLPPLLYEAAWYTSWNDFWKWKRPISLLAFGLVFLTSLVVAYASQALIPGFTLALGFLLGGIVSPPDAVAATTVLKGLKVPKRTIAILEGESLINDASSLIVFRFALAAVMTGIFSMQEATGQFFLVAGMGIVVGILGAHIFYAVHRFLPTTPAIDAALTVMTPYILFLSAEHFHFSGVMAVVSGGLFMSFRAHEMFKTGTTRINMTGVWNTLIFVMNALVFVLIGLELPDIVNGLGEISVVKGIEYGLIISCIVIVVRLLWIYPVAHIPRWLSEKARRDPSPGWKNPLIIGWAGMRGVVSLATALSIPVMMNSQAEFPMRNLIIFITFVVIFVTLVFQGLTLPLIIKLTKIGEIDHILPSHEQQAGIQMRLDKLAVDKLNHEYKESLDTNSLVGNLKKMLENDIHLHQNHLASIEMCTNRQNDMKEYHQIMLDIFALQRKELFRMKREKQYSDDEIRKAESQLDLNELKITGNKHL